MSNQTFKPFPTALLNPCVDPIFKALFTSNSKESHLALTCFLSDMVGKTVTDVVLQPNELSIETATDKQSEFDITCKINGEIVNIEMQGRNISDNYGKRTEYHVAHILNHYTPKGTPWENVPKVYQISVLNFVFDKTEANSYNHYMLKNENGHTISQTINVIFLEIPKVKEIKDDVNFLTAVQMWGKFFLYSNVPEKQDFILELTKHNRGIQMAFKVLKNISQDEINWYRESRYWLHVSDEKTMRNAALREGTKRGMKKGLSEGSRLTAKKLLEMNVLTHEQISYCTGLSIEEIKKMASE